MEGNLRRSREWITGWVDEMKNFPADYAMEAAVYGFAAMCFAYVFTHPDALSSFSDLGKASSSFSRNPIPVLVYEYPCNPAGNLVKAEVRVPQRGGTSSVVTYVAGGAITPAGDVFLETQAKSSTTGAPGSFKDTLLGLGGFVRKTANEVVSACRAKAVQVFPGASLPSPVAP